MSGAIEHILQKYHVAPDAWLSRGMEAQVYTYGADAVLKLYTGTIDLARATTLQDFYASLDRNAVPYALPRIDMIAQEGDLLVIIEQRLYGIPMASVLPSLTDPQLERMMERYLAAARALAALQAPDEFDRYLLFDSASISQRTAGDWHFFLARYLAHKLAMVTPYLRRDVTHFNAKVRRLQSILVQPYAGDYCLIHGDFFPGNLLIDDNQQVTALLDFGLMTLYGDHLFDIATGWVFFDMYDELKARMRERYLALVIEALGEGVRGKLYRYVLIYSILSANMYSPACADGHYAWCVANLNNQHYWDGAV